MTINPEQGVPRDSSVIHLLLRLPLEILRHKPHCFTQMLTTTFLPPTLPFEPREGGLSELYWGSMKLAMCPPHPRVLGARVSPPGKSTWAAGFPTHGKSPARNVQALLL